MELLYDNIDLLLEKYFEGDTTSEEEKCLRLYFNEDNVAERHMQFRPLFIYFGQEIALAEQKEADTCKAPVIEKELPKRRAALIPRLNLRSVNFVYCAAACLAIYFSVSAFLNYKRTDADYALIDGKYITDATTLKSCALEALISVSEDETYIFNDFNEDYDFENHLEMIGESFKNTL